MKIDAHEIDIQAINEELESATAPEIIAWTWRTFSNGAIATSSFQTQSMPLLHLIASVAPEIRIAFLDTGFHFPETIRFRNSVVRQLGLQAVNLTAQIGHDGFLRQFGPLYRQDPDRCCFINKVEPLNRYLSHASAWITGIRRDQTRTRSSTRILDRRTDGIIKIAPLANWGHADVERYIDTYKLPRHPMLADGYSSVGCQPCTRAVSKEGDYRDGRWPNQEKQECGLHEDYFKVLQRKQDNKGT